MTDAQEIAEQEINIRRLALAMIELAVADISGIRGGRDRECWKRTALSWLESVEPGDETNVATFTGACFVAGYNPECIKRAILSGIKPRVLGNNIQGVGRNKNRILCRTYYRVVARLRHKCEFCTGEINTLESHYYRHSTRGYKRAHESCLNGFSDPKIKVVLKDKSIRRNPTKKITLKRKGIFSSIYPGVCLIKTNSPRKWMAYCRLKGISKYIGVFESEIKAHEAYLDFKKIKEDYQWQAKHL